MQPHLQKHNRHVAVIYGMELLTLQVVQKHLQPAMQRVVTVW